MLVEDGRRHHSSRQCRPSAPAAPLPVGLGRASDKSRQQCWALPRAHLPRSGVGLDRTPGVGLEPTTSRLNSRAALCQLSYPGLGYPGIGGAERHSKRVDSCSGDADSRPRPPHGNWRTKHAPACLRPRRRERACDTLWRPIIAFRGTSGGTAARDVAAVAAERHAAARLADQNRLDLACADEPPPPIYTFAPYPPVARRPRTRQAMARQRITHA